MAEMDSTVTHKSERQELCDQLNTIGARLSGIEHTLRMAVEAVLDYGSGDILHMLADVTCGATREICSIAERVRLLGEVQSGE